MPSSIANSPRDESEQNQVSISSIDKRLGLMVVALSVGVSLCLKILKLRYVLGVCGFCSEVWGGWRSIKVVERKAKVGWLCGLFQFSQCLDVEKNLNGVEKRNVPDS
ncbi:hypothetical protein QYF36_014263 [Acer negundo]|nr:hypothetical protein QYF36_014263 [Acer negundo]